MSSEAGITDRPLFILSALIAFMSVMDSNLFICVQGMGLAFCLEKIAFDFKLVLQSSSLALLTLPVLKSVV